MQSTSFCNLGLSCKTKVCPCDFIFIIAFKGWIERVRASWNVEQTLRIYLYCITIKNSNERYLVLSITVHSEFPSRDFWSPLSQSCSFSHHLWEALYHHRVEVSSYLVGNLANILITPKAISFAWAPELSMEGKSSKENTQTLCRHWPGCKHEIKTSRRCNLCNGALPPRAGDV